jgi:hypothetical protein
MVKVVNLTPHPIRLVEEEVGEVIIPVMGEPVRLEEKIEVIAFIRPEGSNSILGMLIPKIKKSFGEIKGLPEPQPNTIFVVSLPVAQVAHRADVLAIGEAIRDEKGNITGAKSLASFC